MNEKERSRANFYYDTYGTVVVSLTKEVSDSIGIFPDKAVLKIQGNKFPCVLLAISLATSKIALPHKGAPDWRALFSSRAVCNLSLSLRGEKDSSSLSLLVQAKISHFEANQGEAERSLDFVDLSFVAKPSNDLILPIGELIEASVNSNRRTDARVELSSPEKVQALGLKDRSIVAMVDNIPRKCVLQDLSFGGAQLIMVGNARFMEGKGIVIHLNTLEGEKMAPEGTIVSFSEIPSRRDLASFSVQFDPEKTPLNYKMLLNRFFELNPS